MKVWIEHICLVIGIFFTLSASLGVLRFPDFFSRMHSASKVSSFGIGFLLLALLWKHWGNWEVMTKSVLIFFFIVLTNPISAHMLMRAAYHLGTPRCPQTHVDEYQDRLHENS
ncbi:MAG: monovalent cation/H(+) antiporter subunit G [Bdellovibrionaceae bacterium]|nr:monovalent cation/H(+) antiporter subunit G [Pseudobdellovibrionaceae bacterium]MDW8189897.1 monovalent cation/H(+) antiporter subunit G [Pseudobdellovibrionaceae bacterium]